MEDREDEGRHSKHWNPTRKQIVILGAACGMAFIHNCNIIHRDLKAENIFLNDRWEPMIADFGFSKALEQDEQLQMSGVMGTPYYMAPELFATDGEMPSSAIDVYAYGVIVLSLFTRGTFNFPGQRLQSVRQLMTGLAKGLRFVIPPSVPAWCSQLIADCWETIPSDRPTFAQIVERLKNPEFTLNGVEKSVYEEYQSRILAFGKERIPEVVKPDDTTPTLPFDFS
jgi:serine/threonine protein kinase